MFAALWLFPRSKAKFCVFWKWRRIKASRFRCLLMMMEGFNMSRPRRHRHHFPTLRSSLFEWKMYRFIILIWWMSYIEMTNSSSFLLLHSRRKVDSAFSRGLTHFPTLTLKNPPNPMSSSSCHVDLYDFYDADKKENFRISWPFQHRLVWKSGSAQKLRVFWSERKEMEKFQVRTQSKKWWNPTLFLPSRLHSSTMAKDVREEWREEKKGFFALAHSWPESRAQKTRRRRLFVVVSLIPLFFLCSASHPHIFAYDQTTRHFIPTFPLSKMVTSPTTSERMARIKIGERLSTKLTNRFLTLC